MDKRTALTYSEIIYLFADKSVSERSRLVNYDAHPSGEKIFGKKLKDAGTDITGIEKVLLENFKNETEVRKAVYYLLDDDESSPWGQGEKNLAQFCTKTDIYKLVEKAVQKGIAARRAQSSSDD